ncbi:hypothetical protein MVEN_01871600 [Mycena venus]|uniref:MYND-type domain-containing protein n=1 Tax=Mycena venus TaxID=2733690 RepID=A0A8H7CMD7_9AGAR|nr:hypothetical protein MVEN_01871600 [Mycena venus]
MHWPFAGLLDDDRPDTPKARIFIPRQYLQTSFISAPGNGSPSDLIFLLRLVPRATDTKRVLLLPLLFVHLDPSRIPTPKDLDSVLYKASRHAELSRATGALAVLRALSEMLAARVVPPPAYTDLWHRLYRWIIFFHLYCEVIPDMDLSAIYHAIAITILDLHRHDSMSAAVNKAAGVRCIMADYWAKSVRGVLSIGTELVASILVFLFDQNSEETEDETKLREILVGIGGSESDLAYLLVKQSNDIVGHPVNYHAGSINIVNSVIQAQSSHGDSLRAGLLAHGGAKALIDAIFYAEEARPHSPLAAEKVYVGLICLLGHFDSDAGAVWISRALSAGLLKLIVALGRSRKSEREEPWLTCSILQRFLIKTLPESLVHYKFAQKIKDALPAPLAIAFSAPFAKCAIATFWTEFAELVQERLRALEFFADRRLMSVSACENIQCGKIGERRTFRKCAGCGLVCYCSPECQMTDWEAAHRGSCRALKSTGPANARERGYVRAILQSNFESPEIRTAVLKQQARFMYTNPGVDFVTVYDFTRNAKGINLSNTPYFSRGWCEIKPISDYAAASGRLGQLLRAAGAIRVHLVVLSSNLQRKAPERILPMWSVPQLPNDLLRIVQDLPRGLLPVALDTALVQPLRGLVTSATKMMQEVYY